MTASDYSDVFVSYRRKDVEFAKQIVEALRDSGREVWIDWEDIAPGSTAFSDDIKRGLEGADAFLCILSPDYMDSTYCVDMEMGYAVELKKKIVPIVLKKFDEQIDKLPDTVKGINWIYFTPHAGQENSFDESFPKIIQVLDQDLEHARQHKRLGLRALEWDANGRNISYVLDGKEITEAENWQRQSADKIPPPTELILEYIAASRKAAISRARFLLTSAVVGLVITVVLAILSFVSFRAAHSAEATAVANEERAVQAEDTAVANFEAAESARATSEANLREAWKSQALFFGDLSRQEAQAGRHQLATLLALKALEHYEENIFSENAYQVLHDALSQRFRTRLDIHYPHGDFGRLGGDVFWLADDTQVLIIAETQITIWDVETLEELLNIPTEAAGDGILSDDESRVIVLSRQDGLSAKVYDLTSGQMLFEVPAPTADAWIQKAAFSSDGTRIYTTSADAFEFFADFTVWDAETGEPQINISLNFDGPTPLTGYAPNPDETQVILWSGFGGSINLFDMQSGDLLWEIMPEDEFGEFVHATWSDDGTYFVVGYNDDSGSSLQIYDAATGELTRKIDQREFITEIIWNAEKSQLLIVATNEIHIYDAATWEPLMQVNHADTIGEAKLNSDESQLLVWSIDATVSIWDMATGEVMQSSRLDATETILQVDWFADETAVSIKTLDMIYLLDIETGATLQEIQLGDLALYAEWNDAGTQLLANYQDDVRVYDSDFGQHLAKFPANIAISGSKWSKDGSRFVLWSDDGGIYVWDDIANDPMFALQADDWVAGVQFNGEMSRLLAWGYSGWISIWDMQSGELVNQIQEGQDLIDVRWNDDNSQVFTLSSSSPGSFGIMSAWDVASGEQLYSIKHDAALNNAIWNADETQILGVFGSDFDAVYEVVIWDIETGDIINQIEVDAPALDAQWNADETQVLIRTGLILAGSDADYSEGAGVIWNLESGETLKLPHEGQVNMIRWNSDETRVLTASEDGTAIVWDASSGEKIHVLPHERYVRDAWWSPDETRIVSYDETLGIWDAESGEMLNSYHLGIYSSVLMNSSGDQLLIIDEFSNAQVIEIGTGKVRFSSELEGDFLLQDAQWHPDETRVLITGFDQYAVWILDYHELIEEAKTLVVRELTDDERDRFFLPPANATDE